MDLMKRIEEASISSKRRSGYIMERVERWFKDNPGEKFLELTDDTIKMLHPETIDDRSLPWQISARRYTLMQRYRRKDGYFAFAFKDLKAIVKLDRLSKEEVEKIKEVDEFGNVKPRIQI